jgi:hypothetical protein
VPGVGALNLSEEWISAAMNALEAGDEAEVITGGGSEEEEDFVRTSGPTRKGFQKHESQTTYHTITHTRLFFVDY